MIFWRYRRYKVQKDYYYYREWVRDDTHDIVIVWSLLIFGIHVYQYEVYVV